MWLFSQKPSILPALSFCLFLLLFGSSVRASSSAASSSSSYSGGGGGSYNDYGYFRDRLDSAMKDVRSILDTTRHPVLAFDDKDHSYEDKYALVETVTNIMLSSTKTVLEKLGTATAGNNNNNNNDNDVCNDVFSEDVLRWVHHEKRPVQLVFTMVRKTNYVKQQLRTLDSLLGGGVTYDHTFSLGSCYKLELAKGGKGNDEHEQESAATTTVVPLRSRNKLAVVPGGDGAIPPNPFGSNSTDRVSLDITWIVEQFADANAKESSSKSRGSSRQRSEFSIDRLDEDCKTPRRNPQVETAVKALVGELKTWSQSICRLLTRDDETFDQRGFQLRNHIEKYSDTVFFPVIPLFENHTTLPNSTIDSFLDRHERSLEEALEAMATDFYNTKNANSDNNDYFSRKEASLALLVTQLDSLVELWMGSVDVVEQMLYSQLEEAIGKRVTAKDFQDFIDYHAPTIFDDDDDEKLAPRPFAYTIRRGKNYPDGVLSLEGYNRGTSPWKATERDHVHTTVRIIPGKSNSGAALLPPVRIPLTPATHVEIRGDRLLHGWLQSQWVETKASYQTLLVARAHQFSSFMLVIGRMRGSSDFLPKQAIILHNKDEVLIPLLTSVLPSAKEFRDSIASLSPEQQEFAKAFREMQLGTSVIGVCVIQIKPQLEKLLNLPEGALTKEIQLTQTLMDLFVEHQIPSDLLSYDGESEASVSKKIATVKKHVKAVSDVISDLIKKEVRAEKLKKEIHKAQRYHQNDEEMDVAGDHFDPIDQMSQRRFSSRDPPPMDSLYSTSTQGSSTPDSLFGKFFGNNKKSSPRHTSSYRVDIDMDLDEIAEVPKEAETSSESSSTKDSTNSAQETPNDDTSTKQEPSEQRGNRMKQEQSDTATTTLNFSHIPKILDARILQEDKDGSLKSTIIKTGPFFHRSRHPNIIQDAVKSILESSQVQDEKNRAMDLLTAISRSGSFPIESSELHVIVGMTHCFPKQIMETIIEDNVNPIQKVEHSLRMIASVIHDKPIETMDPSSSAKA